MAVWARIGRLSPDIQVRIFAFYIKDFCLDMRFHLRYWIEEQKWDEVDPDNPDHETKAENLINELKELFDTEILSTSQNALRSSLSTSATEFKTRFCCAADAVKAIQKCLNEERLILEKEEARQKGLEPCSAQEIQGMINDLYNAVQRTTGSLQNMKVSLETLVIEEVQDAKLVASDFQSAEELKRSRDKLKSGVHQLYNNWMVARKTAKEKIDVTCGKLRIVLKNLDDQQKLWKKKQRLGLIGVESEDNIDQIQEWYSKVAEIALRIRRQTNQMELNANRHGIGEDDLKQLANLKELVSICMTSLVRGSLVVEQQPNQILSLSTEFQAAVRLLISPILGYAVLPPSVTMRIISERQAREAEIRLKRPQIKDKDICGEISNNKCELDYCENIKAFTASFEKLYMTKFRRIEEREQNVTEQKYYMLFEVDFKLDGEETFTAWTTSAPIIVVDDPSQEIDAKATIFWDNAFSELNCFEIDLSKMFPWEQMARFLSEYFKDATGRRLDYGDLEFLRCKMFKDRRFHYTSTITWFNFAKENLPGRRFTFWQWFYSVLQLTKKHLASLWQNDYLKGFIDRQKAEEVLSSEPSGTFLLRFSDSVLGGVSIICIQRQFLTGGHTVLNFEPLTCSDLELKCLEDRLKELNLNLVYPGKTIYGAFHKQFAVGSLERLSFKRSHSNDDAGPNVRRSSESTEPSEQDFIRRDIEHALVSTLNYIYGGHDSTGPSTQGNARRESEGSSTTDYDGTIYASAASWNKEK